MDIRNWITFEEKAKADERDEEIDSHAQTSLAKLIQQRLRAQIDPGIDLKAARRAQSIRATYEGGEITIDEDDQAKLLSGETEKEQDDSEQPASNLEDLFRPGSGVPESVTRPDGSTMLVFRSIKASDLFGQQIANSRSEMVEHAVTDVLRANAVDAVEEAMREVERLHPDTSKR
jgi:hypothetical protein